MGRSKAKSVVYFSLNTDKVWRVLYWVTTVLYVTSKLNKVQLCIDCSHFHKQHLLECVNIPETINNSVQLDFNFSTSLWSILHKPCQLLILLIQYKYKWEITRSSGKQISLLESTNAPMLACIPNVEPFRDGIYRYCNCKLSCIIIAITSV